ncbi:hypothetical protein [Halorubrum vacuolatum]|nr:hypothetical protein [Halorubrum vacuolatum]
MSRVLTDRRRRILTWLLVILFALQSVFVVATAEPIPWTTMAIAAGLAALLVGPVGWIVRVRYEVPTRDRLGLVAFGVAMLLVPLWIGVSLAFELPLVTSFHGLVVGALAGVVLVALVERLVVPEQLRTAW